MGGVMAVAEALACRTSEMARAESGGMAERAGMPAHGVEVEGEEATEAMLAWWLATDRREILALKPMADEAGMAILALEG
jgi:hypothetical protein